MAAKKKTLTKFGELLHTAARGYPALWRDGSLNLAAVAALYKKRGHPVPQPTLHRNCYPRRDGVAQQVSESTIEATHQVFSIPKEMLRGEPVTRRLEEMLARYPLEVLLLAQRIGGLPAEDRQDILRQLERMEERAEQLNRAIQHGSVTPISKRRD
jgi:hypothetical protein